MVRVDTGTKWLQCMYICQRVNLYSKTSNLYYLSSQPDLNLNLNGPHWRVS